LDSAFIAPAIEQLLPNFHGRDASKCAANFIRIENPGCVTVRVEKNQRARLIKINRLSQLVKCTGMIIFDINRQNVGCGRCDWRDNQQRRDAEPKHSRVHRAG